jgi:CRP-like cAMP-binding protein
MLRTEIANGTVRNRVLSNLGEDDFEALRPHLTLVELKRGMTLQNATARLDYVHFIESGCLSRIVRLQGGDLVEVASVGRFDFIGIGFALGTMISLHRTTVLIPGWALRIDVNDLQKLIQARPTIREHLLRYVQSFIVQKSQIALCNARHELDQRIARWMLLAHQQLDDDRLPVTLDSLAMMLSVRPASVSAVLAKFEAEGLINRSRGAMDIIDRDALKQRVCECFNVIQQSYNRLFPIEACEHTLTCDDHEHVI